MTGLPLAAFLPVLPVSAAAAGPRLAVLDWGLAETVLALQLTPLAVAEAPLYRRRVVTPELPPEVVDLGLRTWPNLERLRALSPDLIVSLAGYGVPTARLKSIAPTLPLEIYSQQRAPYRLADAALQAIADRTGRQAQAAAFRQRLSETLERARQRLAGYDGRPVLIFKFSDARHVDVYGDGSLFDAVLQHLGLANAWTEETNIWGFGMAGLDAVARVPDARLVVIAPGPPDSLKTSALWRSLPPVREGRVVQIPPTWVFGALPSAMRFAEQISRVLQPGASS
ncbi:ABC transporter substrate-binding protein [Rhodovibrio salinarum]|uniref:ABC transporter substrate-binding protein n=1 Tax=Rhodovibrio salinarum TaxID=1087 RepID=UPI001906D0FD|nr:ABC transporter substrate-binding protein [Rhodovibrio salinarum]